MSVRFVTYQDSPEFQNLGRCMVEEYVEATELEMDWPVEELVPYIDDYTAFPGKFMPGGDFLIAYLSESPAGCVGITPGEDGLCEMNRLWVRPAFRGRRVGRALAEEALVRARNLGFQRMGLDVLPSREGAVSMYKRLGFLLCEPFHEYEFEMLGLQRKL